MKSRTKFKFLSGIYLLSGPILYLLIQTTVDRLYTKIRSPSSHVKIVKQHKLLLKNIFCYNRNNRKTRRT